MPIVRALPTSNSLSCHQRCATIKFKGLLNRTVYIVIYLLIHLSLSIVIYLSLSIYRDLSIVSIYLS